MMVAPCLVKPMTNWDVLELARDWIGTPYRHQARLKGVGVDCLGLLVGLFKELYGFLPPEANSARYTSHWAELAASEEGEAKDPLLAAGYRWLEPGDIRGVVPGDVVLFRVRRFGAVKHCAIQDTDGRIIHSFDRHRVLSSSPGDVWLRPHRMYVFHWPGVTRWPR